jgi:hypothetical protein
MLATDRTAYEYTSNYTYMVQISLSENFLYAICTHLCTSLSHTMFKKCPFVFKFYNYNWLIRTHPLNPPPPPPPRPPPTGVTRLEPRR